MPKPSPSMAKSYSGIENDRICRNDDIPHSQYHAPTDEPSRLIRIKVWKAEAANAVVVFVRHGRELREVLVTFWGRDWFSICGNGRSVIQVKWWALGMNVCKEKFGFATCDEGQRSQSWKSSWYFGNIDLA